MDDSSAEIGAVVGGLFAATATAFFWEAYFISSSALRRIRDAPSARVSGLRLLLEDSDDSSGRLVVVRGQVQTGPIGWLAWMGVKNPDGALVAQQSGKLAVIVQQVDKCLDDGRQIQGSLDSVRSVPFVLMDGDQYVHVSLDGSTHPLPLTSVYHHMQHVSPTYSSTGTTSAQMHPAAMLSKESILPIGKEITAVGFCRNRNGVLEIKSCMELPYFLSDMTKNEIEAELTEEVNSYFWGGVVLGILAISFCGYTAYIFIRNRRRRKELRSRSQNQELPRNNANEELKDWLFIICLVRRGDLFHGFSSIRVKIVE